MVFFVNNSCKSELCDGISHLTSRVPKQPQYETGCIKLPFMCFNLKNIHSNRYRQCISQCFRIRQNLQVSCNFWISLKSSPGILSCLSSLYKHFFFEKTFARYLLSSMKTKRHPHLPVYLCKQKL